MTVRVKFSPGPHVALRRGKNRHIALAVGGLLIPIALIAYVLMALCLAADLEAVRPFAVGTIYSRWQVWAAIAVVLSLVAITLTGYGRGENGLLPRFLSLRPPLERMPVAREAFSSSAGLHAGPLRPGAMNLGANARTSSGVSSR